MKKELMVAALENGTVIDHIPSENLFKVVSMLKLDQLSNSITIGNNLASHKEKTKGIIKITDLFFEESQINKIALVAGNAKINIIRDFEVIEKKQVHLPDEVVGLVRCNNPKCITNNEPMLTRFNVLDKENITLKCHYCEHILQKEEIILK